jgi:4-amino-4-deoxy-L-arabinose transferase-like glycosyltransferase
LAVERFVMQEKTTKILYWTAFIILMGLGLLIRFYDLNDAPLDFNATRQLHSALIARGMYYQGLESAPQWQRDVAYNQWQAEGLIEPPVMEILSAVTYRIIGSEKLIVPRIYSILFWVLGGVFLFALAKELSGRWAALITLAYFLILPFGAIASRAFQPDPLLTALIVIAWWAMVRWQKQKTWPRLIAAGLLAGLAIFVKSTAVFFVGPAWVALILVEVGIRKALFSRQVWAALILTLLPYGLFMIYGLFISGQLVSQFSLRFFPSLWFDPIWYLQWNGEIRSTVGFEWFLIALVGTAVIKNRTYRTLFLAVWLGYFLYGLTLPYHIYTHDYYQEPLIPLVALGLSGAAGAVFDHIPSPRWLSAAVITLVVVFATTILAWDVRVSLARATYTNEVIFWQKLGDHLGHDRKVIGLTQDYGYRLSYYGWVENTNFLTSGDINYRELGGIQIDEETAFKSAVAGKDIFVVTLFSELDRQPKIKSILYNGYPILEQKSDYVIFDLRHPISPTP